MYILGISAYYHDSAAALLHNGHIVAAAQEERFTRKKHDSRFPSSAISYCLGEAGISLEQVSNVVFYDKPFVKFERLLETYFAYAPRGFQSFVMAMPIWLKDKLLLKSLIRKELCRLSKIKASKLPKLLFSEHHLSHAASAFYPSPYESAAILCLDGVGEWATTTAWIGKGNAISPLWEIDFPHSLGLLYSAFTYYAGFKVNSGEYKLMGLAPYGDPKYVQTILENLIDLKDDGSFRINMDYFNFAIGLTMTNSKFHKLFGGEPLKPGEKISQREMDLARSIQVVTEEIILRLGKTIHQETGEKNLCLAGGVALNCVANGRLLREGPFENIWVQPAAGDAGGSLGAALAAWYGHQKKERQILDHDSMQGSFLGPAIDKTEAASTLKNAGVNFTEYSEDNLCAKVASLLDGGAVVGWVQGRMEFGPRALGARSILADARNKDMQSVMNLKIKFRESFRPFAPAVLAEDVSEYFDFVGASPYMLTVAEVSERQRLKSNTEDEGLFGIDKLKVSRSTIPAVTHVDYSARLQTVHKDTNPKFYRLLSEFRRRTGCSVLVNTSFNVRGEPVVCTTQDAIRCFMRTEMDHLVVENFLISKTDQPKGLAEKNENWKTEFELD